MRSLVIGLAVALMAAPTFGATATISLQTAGSTLVGGENQIDVANISSPFRLDVYVSSSDATGMSAFQFTLTGPSTHSISAPATYFGQVLNYAGQYAGSSGQAGFANKGWDMANGLAWIAEPLPQAGPPTNQIGTVNAVTGVFAQNGWAAWAIINSNPVVGDVFGADGGSVGDSQFQPTELTIIPLRVTPEPASALLLLAGLPLLRRRR